MFISVVCEEQEETFIVICNLKSKSEFKLLQFVYLFVYVFSLSFDNIYSVVFTDSVTPVQLQSDC